MNLASFRFRRDIAIACVLFTYNNQDIVMFSRSSWHHLIVARDEIASVISRSNCNDDRFSRNPRTVGTVCTSSIETCTSWP